MNIFNFHLIQLVRCAARFFREFMLVATSIFFPRQSGSIVAKSQQTVIRLKSPRPRSLPEGKQKVREQNKAE